MFFVETERLILRDMKPEDESCFVAISQDPKYQRFYDESDCEPGTYRDLTHLFIKQANESPRTAYQLAVEHKDNGQFIGTACLRLEENAQASVGCGLSRRYQGAGLIQEASAALMTFAFSELNVHRIYAETISENRAAIKLCQAMGMRKEAHFREHRFFKGRWWDTVILAILQSEWKSKANRKDSE